MRPIPSASRIFPARLAVHRERISRCVRGDFGDDPILRVLSEAVERYAIPEEELQMLVDGVEMDFSRSRYETFDELRAYCTLVASVVGRMCVRIFGFSRSGRARARRRSRHGVAAHEHSSRRARRRRRYEARLSSAEPSCARFGIPESALANGLDLSGLARSRRASTSRSRATYFATRLRGFALHSAPPGGLRANDGRASTKSFSRKSSAIRGFRCERARRSPRPKNCASSCGRGSRARSRRRRWARRPFGGASAQRCGCPRRAFRASRLLGGRATSFEIDGIEVDNGQHVFLACCTEFISFARRVGMERSTCACKIASTRAFFRATAVAGDSARGASTGAVSACRILRDLSLSNAARKTQHCQGARLPANASSAAQSTGRYVRRTFEDWLQRNKQGAGRTPRVLGSVLHSRAQRAIRSRRGGRRALRAANGVFARRRAPRASASQRFRWRILPAAAASHLDAVHTSDGRARLFIRSGDRPRRHALRHAQGETAAFRRRRARRSAAPSRSHPRRSARYGVANLDAYDAFPIVDVHLWHDAGTIGLDFAAALESAAAMDL